MSFLKQIVPKVSKQLQIKLNVNVLNLKSETSIKEILGYVLGSTFNDINVIQSTLQDPSSFMYCIIVNIRLHNPTEETK